MEWIIRAHSRFRSQAFTTSQRFPSKSKFCGLVSCHSRLGFSLQSFPLTGIARPFQGRFASLRFSTNAPNGRHLGLVTAGFFDVRAFGAVAAFLRRLWDPFPRTREHASQFPWTQATEPIRSVSFIRFEALILL